MKRVMLIFTTVSIFMLVSTGQIIDSQLLRVRDENRYKVHVRVYAVDESMIPVISGYIERELRLLNDVEIASEFEADYFLHLVAADLPNTSRIAIATCYFQKVVIPSDVLVRNPGYEGYGRNVYTLPRLRNSVYHKGVLEEVCKGIARYYFR